MNLSRVGLALLVCSLMLHAETDFRFAFPQSEILIGVDVKWLMKSPVMAQAKSEIAPLGKELLSELKPLEGFLEQIDTVYLSAVSKAPVLAAGKPKPAKGANSSDVLLLLTGRFESPKLVEFGVKNGYRMEQWGKTKVLTPALGKKPAAPKRVVRMEKAQYQEAQFSMDSVAASKPVFAIWDSKTIVVGEEAPLRGALERLETGLTPQANPLFERARNLEAANDLWVVGSTAPLNVGGKGDDPFSKMASQVRNFSIGMAARRNLAVDLQLQTTSPKAATQMLDMMKGVVAMARANVKPGEELPIDLDEVLELSATGNILRANLHMEQSDVDKLMARFAPGKVAPTVRPAAKPEEPKAAEAPVVAAAKPETVLPVKPAEPARKTVFIYGLPGGPKEVPVQP
jgi:hypothetical protein